MYVWQGRERGGFSLVIVFIMHSLHDQLVRNVAVGLGHEIKSGVRVFSVSWPCLIRN